jgi:hypothetical protein
MIYITENLEEILVFVVHMSDGTACMSRDAKKGTEYVRVHPCGSRCLPSSLCALPATATPPASPAVQRTLCPNQPPPTVEELPAVICRRPGRATCCVHPSPWLPACMGRGPATRRFASHVHVCVRHLLCLRPSELRCGLQPELGGGGGGGRDKAS